MEKIVEQLSSKLEWPLQVIVAYVEPNKVAIVIWMCVVLTADKRRNEFRPAGIISHILHSMLCPGELS